MIETPKKSKRKPQEIEIDPGAWERFEHAVDAAIKSGPKHRVPTGKIAKKPTQKRESAKTKR